VQDMVKERIDSPSSGQDIEVGEMLQRLIKGLGSVKSGVSVEFEGEELSANARTASSLAVIVTEVLFNALSDCRSSVAVRLGRDADGLGTIAIVDDRPDPSEGDAGGESVQSTSGGGTLVQFLARADFKREVEYRRSEGRFEAEITFPL
jgi:two-component sensor histidine kinase